MTRLKILLLGWAIALSFTACYKSGGELIVTDDPPIVEIDTTIIRYAANLKIGSSTVPADTVFAIATIQPGSPIFYNLEFEVAGMRTCSLFWVSVTQSQPQLIEGTHQGIFVQMLSDSSISLVEDWILDGMINNYPYEEIIIIPADSVEITISDVEENVLSYTLPTGEVMVVDRAVVTLSGSLTDPINGESKEVSGNFKCNFSRPE